MTDARTIDRDAAPDNGASCRWRFTGRSTDLSSADLDVLFDRAMRGDDATRMRTSEILAQVRRDGDRALFALARSLDGVVLERLEVPRRRWRQALDELAPPLRRSMERAADNIARVHRAFFPAAIETSPEAGIVIGRRPDPLGRVGVYAPGGRAVYPSSVLMGAIPARVAGVAEIVLCSPPGAGGEPAAVVLAAAALADVDRVFAIGGAGAIAAMAYGTESVPRVDRVVGPGNAYVAEAKLQLVGAVSIDSPAGPSELLVIADETCDAEIVAREVLAQAEHDPRACVVVLVVGEGKADEIARAIAHGIAAASRRGIIGEALAGQGAIVSVKDIDEAIALANRYAPEHLLVSLSSAERCARVLAALRNVGTVFVGESASNVFGDYMTGANHVLPTGGLARSYSGLSVLDFVRWTTYQRIDRDAAARLAPDVATFADAEDLPGHAAAARAWQPAADAVTTTRASRGGSSAGRAMPRAEVASLPLYDPDDGVPCAVDVSDNTNLWGMPPAAARALRELSGEKASRYPAAYAGSLETVLREYIGIAEAGIVTGCGSDDVLDLIMRAFGVPGDTIAFSAPTFSMIPLFARINGLVPLAIPLLDADSAYDIDAERLADSGAKIIYLCAPNNPTGTTMSRRALEYVLARARGIVILDEAYAEFAAATHVDLISMTERLVVTRTFSKAFGLAGLRVGYAAGAAATVDAVARARGPYKVNAAAEHAAVAALSHGDDGLGWVRRHAALARATRDQLAGELRRVGLAPLPSDANFLLVPLKHATDAARRMREAGVRVRVQTGLPTCLAAFAATEGQALRIGVGPREAMERVVSTLTSVLA